MFKRFYVFLEFFVYGLTCIGTFGNVFYQIGFLREAVRLTGASDNDV